MGRFGEISHQICAQRLEVVNPLAGQQALDPIHVSRALLLQRRELPVALALIFLFDARLVGPLVSARIGSRSGL